MLAAVRQVGRAAARNARQMSSGVSKAEEVKEMNKWRIVSYLALPVCAGLAFYDLSHPEHHAAPPPAYPYLRIRSRDGFPWGPDGLFERKH